MAGNGEAGERPAFRSHGRPSPRSTSRSPTPCSPARCGGHGGQFSGNGCGRRWLRSRSRSGFSSRSRGPGLWLWLPPLGRAIALFVLVVLIAVAAVPLFRFRLPSTFDGLRRLDRGSGLRTGRRPRSPMNLPPASRIRCRSRCGARMSSRRCAPRNALKAGTPRPRLPLFDPIAVRALVVLLVVRDVLRGRRGERVKRITAAFDWAGVVQAKNFRVDAWVTPPAYTGKPPVILPGIRAGEPHQAALIQTRADGQRAGHPRERRKPARCRDERRPGRGEPRRRADAAGRHRGAPLRHHGSRHRDLARRARRRRHLHVRRHPGSCADDRAHQGSRAAGARLAAARLQGRGRLRRRSARRRVSR